MKVQILQENFSKALSVASRFASSKAQLPVLGNIYLSAQKNRLQIISTNLEISVATSIGAQVEKPGEITVPARVISELVSNLNPGALRIEAEKEQLKITSANFSSSISGMNASDFPEVPKALGREVLPLPKEELLKAISQVAFSASIDETRPILTGVLFIFKKGGVVLVSTDGFRLSQKKLGLKGFEKEKKVILPRSVLSEVARLAEEENLSFSFENEGNQVIFGLGDTILSSRTLEGEFPDFERIIPKASVIKVALDKEDLLRSVKLASVFARDSANIVNFGVKKNSVTVSAESQLAGSQESEIEARVEGGAPAVGFEIAFNYRFLEEFLHAAYGEEVNIALSNASAPAVFTDPSDNDFLHLIMPVRIQG